MVLTERAATSGVGIPNCEHTHLSAFTPYGADGNSGTEEIMDSARLIAIVEEYDELYNFQHSQYSNQQRRDSIWEEIGRRMDQPSANCKSRWTRIRDNHRKALHLRKTKSGPAASKMKPPKFHMELQFLTPYIIDEEERSTNLTSSKADDTDLKEEEENGSESTRSTATTNAFATSCVDSLQTPSNDLPQTSSFNNSSTRNIKKRARDSSPQPTAATVLGNYLEYKQQAYSSNQPTDLLIDFFVNMARTVKQFPLQDQIRIKGQLFQMVNSAEMRLAEEELV